MRRARSGPLTGTVAGAAAVLALVVSGCSSSSSSQTPSFAASQVAPNVEGSGVRLQPVLPTPALGSGGSGGGGAAPSSAGAGSSSTSKVDPFVVATKLTEPVGLSLLPDGSALVGERTTGRIVRVQPVAGRPVPTVRTLPGLDTSGDGGLLDLAVSPTYDQDNLIYAYETTATDNRVVEFTLDGPVTPVITGIPKGRTDNTGRLLFAPDGSLYVGTGDAGTPALAEKSTSLAGKVLRLDAIGKPAAGNPSASSPVWTSGHRVVDGLCAVPQSSSVLEVETGAGGSDEVNVLVKGGYYGYPTPRSTEQDPAATLPAADPSPGGCAVLGARVWVTSLDGKALLSAPLTGSGSTLRVGAFSAVLKNKYGRLRTVVAASDGALWLTTDNRDGNGKPVAADERVIRYLPPSDGGGGAKV